MVAQETPAYSEWASVGSGGRDNGEYNLEAFVSADQTLAEHLAELGLTAVSQLSGSLRPGAKMQDAPVSG